MRGYGNGPGWEKACYSFVGIRFLIDTGCMVNRYARYRNRRMERLITTQDLDVLPCWLDWVLDALGIALLTLQVQEGSLMYFDRYN